MNFITKLFRIVVGLPEPKTSPAFKLEGYFLPDNLIDPCVITVVVYTKEEWEADPETTDLMIEDCRPWVCCTTKGLAEVHEKLVERDESLGTTTPHFTITEEICKVQYAKKQKGTDKFFMVPMYFRLGGQETYATLSRNGFEGEVARVVEGQKTGPLVAVNSPVLSKALGFGWQKWGHLEREDFISKMSDNTLKDKVAYLPRPLVALYYDANTPSRTVSF